MFTIFSKTEINTILCFIQTYTGSLTKNEVTIAPDIIWYVERVRLSCKNNKKNVLKNNHPTLTNDCSIIFVQRHSIPKTGRDGFGQRYCAMLVYIYIDVIFYFLAKT